VQIGGGELIEPRKVALLQVIDFDLDIIFAGALFIIEAVEEKDMTIEI
jgi:hypothetical protein